MAEKGLQPKGFWKSQENCCLRWYWKWWIKNDRCKASAVLIFTAVGGQTVPISTQWKVELDSEKMLFACLGSKNECFYSNVNNSTFKGLKLVKSHFWQAVLRAWIDNNHVNSTSSCCTLLWNNRNTKDMFLSSKNGLEQELWKWLIWWHRKVLFHIKQYVD